MHLKKWLEKKRIENSTKAAKKGSEKLVELNNALTPLNPSASASSTLVSVEAPPPAARSQSAVDESMSTLQSTAHGVATAGNSSSTSTSIPVSAQALACCPTMFPIAIPRPSSMPQPNAQALHGRSHTIIGGTMIGLNPGTAVSMRVNRGKDKSTRQRKHCELCRSKGMFSNANHECAGRAGRARCDYFDHANGRRRCWRCWKFGAKFNFNPYTCHATKGHRDDCKYFHVPKRGKCELKAR